MLSSQQIVDHLHSVEWIEATPTILWTSKNDHGRIININLVGARPMVGLQTLDLPIEVRILCPQPIEQSTLRKLTGCFVFQNQELTK